MADDSKEKDALETDNELKKDKQKRSNRKIIKEGKLKGTKEEKFNFSEEVVIGLKRLDNNEEKNIEKKQNQKTKQKNNKKEKKNEKQEEIIVEDIYSKQNNPKKKKKKKKLTKKQRIAQQKRRAILKILGGTTFIFLIIGGGIFILRSPIFNINNITVTGNAKISSNELISLSTLKIQENMFKYNFKEIEDAIKENPYIKTVELNRKLPDTVEIVVEERVATYMIQVANAYAYIDNQGYILEISDQKKMLPILKGITTKQEEIHPKNRLSKEDLKKLNDVLEIMKSAKSNALSKFITTIDITDDEDYIITMETKKKTIHFGDTSNISTKMLLITQFNEQEKNTEGTIFLNMNLNDENNNPYFRKKI